MFYTPVAEMDDAQLKFAVVCLVSSGDSKSADMVEGFRERRMRERRSVERDTAERRAEYGRRVAALAVD